MAITFGYFIALIDWCLKRVGTIVETCLTSSRLGKVARGVHSIFVPSDYNLNSKFFVFYEL